MVLGRQGNHHLTWQIEEPGKVKVAEEKAVYEAARRDGKIPAAHDLQTDDGIAEEKEDKGPVQQRILFAETDAIDNVHNEMGIVAD